MDLFREKYKITPYEFMCLDSNCNMINKFYSCIYKYILDTSDDISFF